MHSAESNVSVVLAWDWADRMRDLLPEVLHRPELPPARVAIVRGLRSHSKGAGTGEPLQRLLTAFPSAKLVGIEAGAAAGRSRSSNGRRATTLVLPTTYTFSCWATPSSRAAGRAAGPSNVANSFINVPKISMATAMSEFDYILALSHE